VLTQEEVAVISVKWPLLLLTREALARPKNAASTVETLKRLKRIGLRFSGASWSVCSGQDENDP
jgi:hypothetical protein